MLEESQPNRVNVEQITDDGRPDQIPRDNMRKIQDSTEQTLGEKPVLPPEICHELPDIYHTPEVHNSADSQRTSSDSDPPDSGYACQSTDSSPSAPSTDSTPSSDSFPTAPDGGWGWVVCMGAFFSMVILDGMMFSFGVLFLELLDYFQMGKGQTAMVGSALMGTHLIAGPITSALVNAWGVRNVSMIGSILATLAFACSILSPNITVLTVMYGFIGGFGVSMIYLPSILAVGFYFEKRRALANGITHSGSGIGTFLYSPLTEFLLGRYGWKGTMLILSGLVLNCLACSALFRPVQHKKRRKDAPPGEKEVASALAQQQEVESLRLLDNDCIDVDLNPEDFLKHGNSAVVRGKAVAQMLLHRETRGKTPFFSSVPAITVISQSTPSSPTPDRHDRLLIATRCHCGSHGNSLTDTTATCPQCDVMSPMTSSARRRTQSHSKLPTHVTHLSRDHGSGHVPWNMKPMYRKDAFYSGSLLRLPEYQAGRMASLYSLPDRHTDGSRRGSKLSREDIKAGVAEANWCGKPICSKLNDICPMIRQMTGLGLMCNSTFLITMLSMVMWTTHSTVLTLLPDCAVTRGVSRDNAAFLLSIIGVANTAARVLAGWVSDRPEVNCLYVNIAALLLGSASCVMMAFTSSFPLLALESTLFGLGMGTWTSLRPIILVEMLGLDNLTNAFGLVAMFQGVAFLVGPPIAGAFFEQVHSYTTPFVLTGVAFAISSMLCGILCVRTCGICHKSRDIHLPSDAGQIDVKVDTNFNI